MQIYLMKVVCGWVRPWHNFWLTAVMRPTIFLLMVCTGCATSNMQTFVQSKLNTPFYKLMIVQTEVDQEFQQLDSLSFESHIKGSLTSLSSARFREQMERSFKRKLTGPRTVVETASDHFPINSNVTYNQFKQKIKELDIDAVLVINVTGYWQSAYTSFSNGYPYQNVEPNAAYNCYLLDVETFKPAWMSRIVVNGIWAGFDTLNNRMAQRVANKLTQGKFIYPIPDSYYANR